MVEPSVESGSEVKGLARRGRACGSVCVPFYETNKSNDTSENKIYITKCQYRERRRDASIKGGSRLTYRKVKGVMKGCHQGWL